MKLPVFFVLQQKENTCEKSQKQYIMDVAIIENKGVFWYEFTEI